MAFYWGRNASCALFTLKTCSHGVYCHIFQLCLWLWLFHVKCSLFTLSLYHNLLHIITSGSLLTRHRNFSTHVTKSVTSPVKPVIPCTHLCSSGVQSLYIALFSRLLSVTVHSLHWHVRQAWNNLHSKNCNVFLTRRIMIMWIYRNTTAWTDFTLCGNKNRFSIIPLNLSRKSFYCSLKLCKGSGSSV